MGQLVLCVYIKVVKDTNQPLFINHLSLLCLSLLVHEQKYPPSATTLHFEFYAEPGPEVKVERKVKTKTFIYEVIQ